MRYARSFEVIKDAIALNEGQHVQAATLDDADFIARLTHHPYGQQVTGEKIEGRDTKTVAVGGTEIPVDIASRAVLLNPEAHSVMNEIPGHYVNPSHGGPRAFLLTKVDFRNPNGGYHQVESLTAFTGDILDEHDAAGTDIDALLTTSMPKKSIKRPEAVAFHYAAIEQIGLVVPTLGHLASRTDLRIGTNSVVQTAEQFGQHILWLTDTVPEPVIPIA